MAAAAAAMMPAHLLAQEAPADADSPLPRQMFPLTDGWKFAQADKAPGAEKPDFDDSRWQDVTVPHTWNRVGLYDDVNPSHVNRPDQINKERGVGWYRLAFEVPKTMAGQRAWLQFDGASVLAEVWLNGVRLGEHRGGFSRFRLDATAAIRLGARNLLVVKTDNSLANPGVATQDILPLRGDFFVYGGLYRPVSLIFTAPVHFDMLDYGGPGLYLRTAKLEKGVADVAFVAKIRNDTGGATATWVDLNVADADGRPVATGRWSAALPASNGKDVAGRISIPAAHLWQGVADPYLYTVTAIARSARGQILDRVVQQFGVRQVAFDPNRGMLLNDKPLRLHGVTMHQDREGKGWAITADDLREDVELVADMGANTIRLTHYQQAATLHDLADRYGIILWDEIPLITQWTLGKALEPTPALVENAGQQLRELIRQNYNHPSSVVWGLANEVDFGFYAPAFQGGLRTPPIPDPKGLLANLRELARQEDPYRPTVLAECCLGTEGAPDVIEAADLSGANRYFGWYYGSPIGLGAALDALHAAHPHVPLALSEYGAGAAVSQFTEDPLGGPVNPRGRPQPEDYQSHFHEAILPVLEARPWLWGEWITFMFDFASTARKEGDSVDINTKGLVSFDRRLRKDAFFFYRANWNPAPTVHIANRRYIERLLPVTDVKVYSNARRTEAWLNGQSLGTRSECPQRICLWRDVRLHAGNNAVTASGDFPTGPRRDEVAWRLAVPKNVYRIDAGSISAHPGPGGNYASDARFVGGEAAMIRPFGDFGADNSPAKIGGTPYGHLYNSYRRGRFAYRLPIANGRYQVTLQFVEPGAAQGARVFSVLANGRRMIGDLDIAATAGALKPLTRSFQVVVSGEQLDLTFEPSHGEAIVAAIDVEPARRPAR